MGKTRPVTVVVPVSTTTTGKVVGTLTFPQVVDLRADPITFSILSGQEKTGVSLMLIDEGMDTGKILVQKSLPVLPDDTSVTLTEKLVALSNNLLGVYASKYLNGDLKPRSQPHPSRATYSRKLEKKDGEIDWKKPAADIERQVRAFIEWPKSRTALSGIDIIITKAKAVNGRGKPGEIKIQDNKLLVYCGSGAIEIIKLKPAGKAEMDTAAFLAGYKSKL